MNKKLKYFILTSVIFWIFLSWYILNADEKNIPSGYELYTNRNEEICKKYEPENPIFSTEKFPDLNKDIPENQKVYSIDDNDLEVAQKIYVNNVNSIYACAMIWAQERSINFIMQELGEDKETWALNKAYTAQLDNIKRLKEENECLSTNKSNNPTDKKNMLDQVTNQLCQYNNYLEYLKEYNSITANIVQQDKKLENGEKMMQNYNISDIISKEKEKKSQIENEITKAYDLYPIALKAYNDYETNLPIHDLLTLLQKNYVDLRLELHKNLNPINQVVYKISNAMKE